MSIIPRHILQQLAAPLLLVHHVSACCIIPGQLSDPEMRRTQDADQGSPLRSIMKKQQLCQLPDSTMDINTHVYLVVFGISGNLSTASDHQHLQTVDTFSSYSTPDISK
jgi:hypothetical protein